MNGEHAILQAIESLTEEVRCGFDRLEEQTNELEKRVDGHDKSLTQIRTLWAVGTVVVAASWDGVKQYIFGGSHGQR